jgi:predicted DNA-binding transcriptional regulator AlpA
MDTNQRLIKLLSATPEQQSAVDKILDGKMVKQTEQLSGPLLLNMTESAKLLGCSRTCLWRVLRAGRLKKVELFPGSFRLRRSDLLELVDGKKGGRHETPPK